MPLTIGSILAEKYRIEQLLGVGGFGYVYRATHLLLGSAVAVKELKPEASQDVQALQRFLQEARAAANLNHPNIVTVHDLETEGGYFIIMEFMAGGSLDGVLAQRPNRRLTPAEAVGIIAATCDGLAAAHGLGIVHRDIKPSNILFTADGRPKLADFGIAHVPAAITGQAGLTQTGLALGTVLYMSPEQARGERVDSRADLYALGAVLYETLLGRRYQDFDADSQIRNLHIIAYQPPIPPRILDAGLSRSLEQVILKALAKEPGRRYQTAAEFRDALLSLSPRALATPAHPVTPLKPVGVVRTPTPAPISPRPVSPRLPTPLPAPAVEQPTVAAKPVTGDIVAPTVAVASPAGAAPSPAPVAVSPTAEPEPVAVPPVAAPVRVVTPAPVIVPPVATPPPSEPGGVAVSTPQPLVPPNRRRLPLAIAGIAGGVLLLIGLVWGSLAGRGMSLTPAATSVSTTVTLLPSAITPVPATATRAPTSTPVPPTVTRAPTVTPVPPMATSVPTATPVPPTATRVAPTSTPIPPPTATPLPPAPTSQPGSYSVPLLLSPANGQAFYEEVPVIELSWQPVGTLAADDYYDIYLTWRAGGRQVERHWYVKDTRYTVGQEYFGVAEGGRYDWNVVIRRGQGTNAPMLSPISEQRHFFWRKRSAGPQPTWTPRP